MAFSSILMKSLRHGTHFIVALHLGRGNLFARDGTHSKYKDGFEQQHEKSLLSNLLQDFCSENYQLNEIGPNKQICNCKLTFGA
jgi:hypothetical protein